MSHEEFIRNQREMYYDRKHDAALQAVAEAAAENKLKRINCLESINQLKYC
jgi:hypothetical protein